MLNTPNPHIRYYLYFAGFDGKTEQVGVATSPDQQQWTVHPEPIIAIGKAGEWDSTQTSNPCVLYEDGRFRMWYQGVDDEGRYRIGYAESQDGITFTKYPNVIFEREGIDDLQKIPRREGFHQPLVLPEANRYLMYFLDHRQGLGYVRVAESQDGLSWTISPDDCLAPEKSWESRGLHYPWVIKEDNQYTMWYTSEAERTRWNLSRAVSQDGIHWQRNPTDRPVIDIRLPRTVSRLNYLVPRKLLINFPNYLHPQFRASGLREIKARNPLILWLHDKLVYPLRTKRYISFNNSSVEKLADGSYLMYFQAYTENGDLAIGNATSQNGIDWKPRDLDILRNPIQENNIAWCSVFDGDPHLLIMKD